MSGNTIYNYKGKEIFLPDSPGYVHDEQIMEFLSTFFPDAMEKLQQQIEVIKSNTDAMTPDVDSINTTTADTFSWLTSYFPSEFSTIKSTLSDIYNETSSIDGNVSSLNSTISMIMQPAVDSIQSNVSTMLDAIQEMSAVVSNISSATRRTIRMVDVSVEDMNVAAGTIAYFSVTPPEGEIWKILNCYIEFPVPDGASSGTQAVRIIPGSQSWWLASNLMESSFNVPIGLRYSEPMPDTEVFNPTDRKVFFDAISNLRLTNAYPLWLRYNNYTDVDNRKKATISLMVEVTRIV